jgi:general secretion pathway protein D
MRRFPAVAAMLLLALLATAPARVDAQQNVQQTQQGLVLNFQDVDLAYVISALGQAAGLNIQYADLPQKLVTVRTTQPVAPADVAALIRSLAEANGVSYTEADGFIRLQGAGEQQVPRQLYIQRLRHARAPVLAATLQALFGGGSGVSPTQQRAQTLSQQLRMMEAQAQAAQQGQQVQVPQIVIAPGAVGAADLVGPINIVADEVTNSLLVRATAQDWQIIQQAIQSLDLRPLSVVIEVIIAEVRRNDELNVGVSIIGTNEDADGGTTGELPGTTSTDQFSITYVHTGDINVEATLSALAATGNLRIISRPIIQAQNNQEARILVGTEQPFVAIQRALPTDEVQFTQSIQYREVGTALTILPTINDDGYVNLAVTQEVSSVTNETQFDAPVISTREAVTQILARNGQTVAIGGLVDHQRERVRSGIPFLKDIPILGYLFGSTRNFDSTSELFLFLTPYIVTNDEDADRLRRELENNATLLEGVVPIQPILPQVIRATPPDTTGAILRPDTLPAVRRDTLSVVR